MKWVILAFLMILLAGFFHIMFIMYDNIWYNESTGIIPQLADKLNNSLSDDVRNNSWNKTQMFKDAFGIGRVVCIALVPICIVIQAVDKPRIQG